MRPFRKILLTSLFCVWAAACLYGQSLRFEVTVPASAHAAPITGRVFVILSRSDSKDLLGQIDNWEQETPFFGVDVSNLSPGTLRLSTRIMPGLIPSKVCVRFLPAITTSRR